MVSILWQILCIKSLIFPYFERQSGQGKNIESLRNKLIAGKNEHSGGYQKFATAQFYGKCQNEQTGADLVLLIVFFVLD